MYFISFLPMNIVQKRKNQYSTWMKISIMFNKLRGVLLTAQEGFSNFVVEYLNEIETKFKTVCNSLTMK